MQVPFDAMMVVVVQSIRCPWRGGYVGSYSSSVECMMRRSLSVESSEVMCPSLATDNYHVEVKSCGG